MKNIKLEPNFIKTLTNGSVLGLIETNFSTEKLLEWLNWKPSKLYGFHELRSEKKQKEYLGVRLLLKEIFKGEAFNLKYNNQGKPFLSDQDFHISISHSGKYVCVLINQNWTVGVDIQIYKPNIEKGISLFMSNKELEDCSGKSNTKRIHIYWGAKEAIYKFHGKKETNIKTDIYISPFELEKSGNLAGKVLGKKQVKVSLNYQITGEYILVYTV